MIIQGKNVLLRTIQERDLEQLYPYHTDLEARGPYFPIYIPSESEFRRIYNESGFWTQDHGDVLICDLQDNLLGVLIFFRSAPYFDGYEIGYRLFDPQENGGRGITTEALILLTYVLFAIHKINRLELKIDPENQASKRVAQKASYQYEGIARGAAFLRGRYVDLEVWSILRSEAPSSREAALTKIP